MKLRNILIVVKDIARARKYYHDLFGLDMLLDNDENMILTEGLVLQQEACWTESLNKEVLPRNNRSELYFEETDREAMRTFSRSVAEKLEQLYPETEYVSKLMTHSWGQKVIRFYDLDGNLIEVGTPVYFNYVTPIEVSRK